MAISFIDCINHGDVDRQATFMHEAFELRGGKVLSWTLTEDTPEARERWGLAG